MVSVTTKSRAKRLSDIPFWWNENQKNTAIPNKLQSRGLVRALRCLTTFAIVSIAWVFFAQPTAGDAIDVLGHMFSSEGQAKIDLFIPLLLVAVVLIKDIGDEFNIKNLRVLHHPLPIVRWTFYSIIMAVILIFAEGGENFIYSGF